MHIKNIMAGQPFPRITVPKFKGDTLNLGEVEQGLEWKMVVVYRGVHCPICTNYLKGLNLLVDEFNALGVDVVVVSADSQNKVKSQMAEIKPKFSVGYGLTIEQMKAMGLFISNPRNEQETDRPFSEPGLFVINSEGLIQVLDISNAPFARPEFTSLLKGLTFIRNPENNYPIRGTYQ